MDKNQIKKILMGFLKSIKRNGHFYTKQHTDYDYIAHSQEWLQTETMSFIEKKKWEAIFIPDTISNSMIDKAEKFLAHYN